MNEDTYQPQAVLRGLRAPCYEVTYGESAAAICPNPRVLEELVAPAIDRIQQDAEGCEQVNDVPLMSAHGPMRVSRCPSPRGELAVYFTLHDPDDQGCSIWRVEATAHQRQEAGPLEHEHHLL